MSRSSITIDPDDQFDVIDYYAASDDRSPVDDATKVAIKVGEDVTLLLNVSQWRALVAAVDEGIEDIPAKRRLRLAALQMARAARSDQVPA